MPSAPKATLAIREQVALADVFDWLAEAFAELRSAVSRRGGRRAGADAALYSSELLEDEHGEVVAFLPVTGAPPPRGRIEPLRLAVVEYAGAVHRGSFENLDRTFAALGTVVAERAIGVQGPIREDYLVGPLETQQEAEHRTEICWPVFRTTPAY